jgi:hypothetical protein
MYFCAHFIISCKGNPLIYAHTSIEIDEFSISSNNFYYRRWGYTKGIVLA